MCPLHRTHQKNLPWKQYVTKIQAVKCGEYGLTTICNMTNHVLTMRCTRSLQPDDFEILAMFSYQISNKLEVALTQME